MVNPQKLNSKNRILADISLLMAAIFWGSSFVPQRAAALVGGVFLYNGMRFLLGVTLLIPLFFYFKPNLKLISMRAWLGGGLAGIVLFVGSSFQQFGLQYTTAANAGFITGLYVIIIPFILALVYRRPPRLIVWIGSCISVLGIFLLSTGGKFALSSGDAWEVVSALMGAAHVLIIDRVIHELDLSVMAILQGSVCGILSLIVGIFYEHSTISSLNGIWWAVIWNGIASIALGFTLQGVGQKYAPPADAAIILCLESVFAAFFGWVILKEGLATIQIIGAMLMFGAMLIVQFSTPATNFAEVKETTSV